MLLVRNVCQPDHHYRTLFGEAASAAAFTELSGAFAYATVGGVNALMETLDESLAAVERTPKRWLISIDWCRTEPAALRLLSTLPSSEVRIADGRFVVGRVGCTPRVPWHPKVLILRGDNAVGVAAGSGNLSRNGMTGGHEVGTATVVKNPRSVAERQIHGECLVVANWFDAQWANATKLRTVESQYAQRFKAAVKTRPPLTDDDTLPKQARRGVDLDRIQKMRAASKLWIDAGNLHRNLGQGQPGNQLMLSAMTRVFFGAGAQEVPNNTHLGYYSIRFNSNLRTDCSLRFSDNSMDVLGLPLPGTEGPAAYDQETLCFTRVQEKGAVIFEMEVGTGAQRRTWKANSRAAGSGYAMQGGRQWGVIP